jgi:RNA-directed DNA polymerase
MRVNSSVLKRLDLTSAVESQLKRGIARFPPLIIDICLNKSASLLTKEILATFEAGTNVSSETLTMPRKVFGLRPVSVTSISSRCLYQALVAAIEEGLPEPTRATGNWAKHTSFGFESDKNYAVDVDVASYYEYIDHDRLTDEIILRTMDVPISHAIQSYLGELQGITRGLPQMQHASDRLADAYLSILDRRLSRSGYAASRFVDDIRILADSWEHANGIIEQAAEGARDLGLILATGKTSIAKISTLIEQKKEEEEFYTRHFSKARKALTSLIITGGNWYDDNEEVEVIEPEDKEAAQGAAWSIFTDWRSAVSEAGEGGEVGFQEARFVTRNISALHDYSDRLSDDILKELVFRNPTMLDQVVRYIIARGLTFSNEESYKSLEMLVAMGRQSPWAKLWFLTAIPSVPEWIIPGLEGALGAWVEKQLDDRHETVRAEAAWVCAQSSRLSQSRLAELYSIASPISQPALAACAKKQSGIQRSVASGIIDDSPLNKSAAKWAEEVEEE